MILLLATANTCMAIPASVLNHFKRLRRHFRVAEQRNAGPATRSRRSFRGRCVLGFDGTETQQKREEIISQSEMERFAARP